MFELLFKDIDEEKFNEIAKGYTQFNRTAPQLKHFKRALLKVALGKRCGGKKLKKELSEVGLMMQLLKGVAQKLEVKA
jgi:hypothetical protein